MTGKVNRTLTGAAGEIPVFSRQIHAKVCEITGMELVFIFGGLQWPAWLALRNGDSTYGLACDMSVLEAPFPLPWARNGGTLRS